MQDCSLVNQDFQSFDIYILNFQLFFIIIIIVNAYNDMSTWLLVLVKPYYNVVIIYK